MRDAEGALEDYAQAIAANPRLVEAYASRATLFHERGEREAAAADARRALELAPADWPYRKRLEELARP